MLKEIKHQFMTYRNGVIADTLRKAGMPYSLIFGLQLPDLSRIAREQQKSMQLAQALWDDRNVRESRLLACWLFPEDEVSPELALSLAADVLTREEADILAFRLLRRLPRPEDLAKAIEEEAAKACSPLQAYAAQALRRNLR